MTKVRLAEALGALSFATDLAAGQPQGTALGATVLAVRLGRRLGLGTTALADLYYASIVRRIGCTSTASVVAPLALGDERAANLALNLSDLTNSATVQQHLQERLPHGEAATRAAAISGIEGMGDALFTAADAHCVQAVALTRRMPVPTGVRNLLDQVDARWDGRNPIRAEGADIPRGTRIMECAAILELHRRACGLHSALEVAAARAGSQFDPEVARLFRADHAVLAAGLDQPGAWATYLDSEPCTAVMIGPHDLRQIAYAFADFADQKSRFFLGHSRRVAALAFRAAVEIGLEEHLCQSIFDAALVHDIGRCAVPTGVWEKPGDLDPFERIEAESHSYYTERILAISAVFRDIAECASSVHERCDGSGYHRKLRLTDRRACVLAAANHYDELAHATAARAALTPAAAARALRQEAAAGRLQDDCVRAVLQAAGHRVPAPPALPGGLTRRESEVLRRIALGDSGKSIARTLGVTPKTVDKHTENIFRKIGVNSRTAAALFAMENGLLAD